MNRLYRKLLLALVLAVALSGSFALAQPVITLQPLDLVNLLLGDSATFSAAAVSPSSTNLTYQWLKNGVPIPGETNATLKVNNVQATNCGAFSMRASDGEAVTESTAAELTVNILQLLGNNLVLDVTGLTGSIRSSTVGASKQAGEPIIIPGDPGGNPVWFQWTPLLSGIVTFTTAGSDFDTIMGVYTGSTPSNLTQVPSAINDDDGAGYLASQVTFNAQALTTYTIGVDGHYGASGNVVLSWNESLSLDTLPPLKNPLPSVMAVSNGAAVNLPSPWAKACQWFFNGQPLGSPMSELSITNFGLTNVGAYVAQFSTSDGHTVSSEPLHIQMNVLQNGTTAAGSFAWNKFLDSANNAFTPSSTQSQTVSQSSIRKMSGGDTGGYTESQTFSTVGNTEEPGEPSICGQTQGHPEWYAYVTPAGGSLVISTAGSSFNTQLGVFIGPGTGFTTLTNVGCGFTTNYQLNGQPVVTITNVPANQTNYIIIDGENGASGTARLNISLNIPLTILSAPSSLSVAPGSNVTFSIGATGGTPLGYFWESNGVAIPGATSSTLTLNNVQAGTAATYTAFVTNSVSIVNSAAVLTVVTPPSITTQPSSETVNISSNVTLTCAASGPGPLYYQWQLGGTLLPSATNNSLPLSNVQTTNAGSYSCVVSNAGGVTTSAAAVLTVQSAPVILTQPISQTVAAGSSITLNVSASAVPSPSYQWYFNSSPIGKNTSQLSLSHFASASQGTYSVVVSNSLGTVTSTPAILLLSSAQGWINSYGVNNGAFQIQLVGAPGSNYVVQASSDLVHWTPVFTNIAAYGFVQFTDTNAGALTGRFYRTVSQ